MKRALSALPALEGDAIGVSLEACASLEDQAPTGETPLDDEATNDALHVEEVGGPPPRSRRHSLALFGALRTRPLEKMILSSYVKPLEWSRPAVDAPTPDYEAARLLVRKCNPFDMRDSSITHLCNFYPHIFPFPSYLDKGSYQRVAEDRMYIPNHDFNETDELVWSDL